ncbi:MAG: 30S ribosomal protein S8e [Candidatus Odinarchaeia archaeon]
MVRWQGRSSRKATGAKLRPYRGKRKYEMGREAVETKLGETKKKLVRVRGGNIKVKLLQDEYINVNDPKTKKTYKLKILSVVSNIATVDYQRRGVITKGAIVKTEKGNVRVTSRPGQHGLLNGVLLTE